MHNSRAISFISQSFLAFTGNCENYEETVANHLLPVAEDLGEEKKLFQSDNALIHTSNPTSITLKKISVLK